ncbi:endoprotease bli-like [Salarias fasciatus]|uniref:endoprotease bli-like n=1 Tax=Salarias fasciatus TaxID=181472 RepID=UPI001176D982|nr:endoprotease bli-like [Salarias fasciatus]
MEANNSYCGVGIAFNGAGSEGEGGEGSVSAWAAGNGGMRRDRRCADGIDDSICTIATGAVNQSIKPAHFGKPLAWIDGRRPGGGRRGRLATFG